MRALVFLLVLFSAGARAAGLTVEWTAVTQDIDGNPIPSTVIEYVVYGSKDGSQAVAIGRTPGTTGLTEELPMGCYEVYVTAYRKDAMLESIPSNKVAKCLDGSDDDDGTVIIPTSPAAPELGPLEKVIRR